MPIVLLQKGLVGHRKKNQSQQNQRFGYSTSEIPCALGLMDKSGQAMHRRTNQSSQCIVPIKYDCQFLPYKVIAKKASLLLSLNLLFCDSCLYNCGEKLLSKIRRGSYVRLRWQHRR
jgi:hypothetical protein